jgi:hypothetical protein
MTPRSSASRLVAATAIALWLSAARAGSGQELGARDGAPRAGQQQQQQLVREFQQRLAEVVKTQVGLSDEQFRRLMAANRKYEQRRRELNQEERLARIELRREVLAEGSADEARVGELLDRVLKVQRERVAVLEDEQKELAGFMSAVQRAKYMAVQDQIRRRIQEMRRRREQGLPLGEPARRRPLARP